MSKQTSHSCGSKWAPGAKTPSLQWQFKHDTVALWEIHQYQKTIKLFWKLPCQRLIWKITQDLWPNIQFQGIATGALQEAAEAYLIGLFEDTNLCTIHPRWVTILPCDMQLAWRMWSNWFWNQWHWYWVECGSVPRRSPQREMCLCWRICWCHVIDCWQLSILTFVHLKIVTWIYLKILCNHVVVL